MADVIFWGATGQAKVLYEALLNTEYRIVAIFDNHEVVAPLPGIPLYIGSAAFGTWLTSRGIDDLLYFCTAIGGKYGHDRMAIHEHLCMNGLKPLTIKHRTAFIAIDAKLGQGCQILAQSAVCTHAQLGRSVIVNTAASIDHDCFIGDGVHIGPGATLAGEVIVGPYSFIGAGAVVLPRLRIGEDAIVGAGAVVTKNVPIGAVVIGNPARQIKMSPD
jgi:sugar O-acyltransferase (sialic acid O-acetyltransferase NeuD family)